MALDGEAEDLPFAGSVFTASMSSDARYIAFDVGILSTDVGVYLYDTQSETFTHITSGANASSYRPLISADGRYVVFLSYATNLVTTTSLLPASGRGALYRYDSNDGSIEVVSLNSAGGALNTGVSAATTAAAAARFDYDFSRDGNYIVFNSDSTNVFPGMTLPVFNLYMYRRNLNTGAMEYVNRQSNGTTSSGLYTNPAISADGNRVAYVGAFIGLDAPNPDTPASFSSEAFAIDFTTDTVWWVSRTIGNVSLAADFGSVANVEISGDGSVVGLEATSENLVVPTTGSFSDIFRVDLVGNGTSTIDFISGPTDGSATNVRVATSESLYLPAGGDFLVWKSTETEAFADIGSTLREEDQVVAVGDFSGLGGGTMSFADWATALPAGSQGENDIAFPDGIPNVIRYLLDRPTDQASSAELFQFGAQSDADLGIGSMGDQYGTVTISIRADLDPGVTWSIRTGRTITELLSGAFEALPVGTPLEQEDMLQFTLRTPYATNAGESVFFQLVVNSAVGS